MRTRSALYFLTMILALAVGCSSEDSNTSSGNTLPAVTPSVNPADDPANGLWEGRTLDLTADNLPEITVPAGSLYFSFKPVNTKGTSVSIYTKERNSNCLNSSRPITVANTGQNQYIDSAGVAATIIVSGNEMDLTIPMNNGFTKSIASRTVGITESDLSFCDRSDSPGNTVGFTGLFDTINSLLE